MKTVSTYLMLICLFFICFIRPIDSGPVTFAACIEGLALVSGASAAALKGCLLLGIPPLICSCAAGIIGVAGIGGFGVCLVALASPTP